ncbi:MAG: hypothetical protein ABID87_06725 [Chloroflexota bacterium]
MRRKIARLVSDIINPFSISLVMIVLLSFRHAASFAEGLKWSLLSVAFSILPVLVVILVLVHNEKLEGIFIRARQQRHRIYLLASVCVLVSIGILYYLGAPRELLAAFVTALLAIGLYLCINLWWKISVHTGFLAASLMLLIIMYRVPGILFTLVLLPVMAWSRVELEHHTPAQVAAGAALSAAAMLAVFHFFGLIA